MRFLINFLLSRRLKKQSTIPLPRMAFLTPTVSFALVVVQHPDNKRFVLVHEKTDRGWWLPGGGLDYGESYFEGAVRETREEAGADVEITGILRVEHTLAPNFNRLRLIFHGRPIDASKPLKSKPDHESKGAEWVTVEEMQAIGAGRAPGVKDCHLRGEEPRQWFQYLAAGGPVYPANFLKIQTMNSTTDAPPEVPPGARAIYGTSFGVSVVVYNADRTHYYHKILPGDQWLSKKGLLCGVMMNPVEPFTTAATRAFKTLGWNSASVPQLLGIHGVVQTFDNSCQMSHFHVVYAAQQVAGGVASGADSAKDWAPVAQLQASDGQLDPFVKLVDVSRWHSLSAMGGEQEPVRLPGSK